MNDRMDDAMSDGMDEQDLKAPLAALRSALSAQQAPPAVEQALMDAFARQFPRKRWYHALSPRQWGVAGGVTSTALAAVLALSLSLQAPHNAGLAAEWGAAERPLADAGPDFIALASADRIEQEQDPQMVQADVPRTALAAFGVPLDPETAGDSVRAEMLVGADGSPLALRLVLP